MACRDHLGHPIFHFCSPAKIHGDVEPFIMSPAAQAVPVMGVDLLVMPRHHSHNAPTHQLLKGMPRLSNSHLLKSHSARERWFFCALLEMWI